MDYFRTELPNGLRVIHTPMPGIRSASVTLFVGLGSRFESDCEGGASHLIEHMLFKGTTTRPTARHISEAIESVGGVLNASTDKELTAFWAKVAEEHFPLAVDLLADMVRHSRFRPSDVQREKAVVLEELNMLLDDPQDWVHSLMEEVLWPRQAVGREIAGTRASVAGLQRADLQRYMKRFYGADNAVISIAGGIDRDDSLHAVVEHFGDWGRADPWTASPADIPEAGPRTRLEYKPTEQVNVCLAYPAVPRLHPDRWPLDVLCTILGGGTSSRLFVQLREQQGLAYDVHAYSAHLSDTGAVVIYAGTEAGKSGRAIDHIMHEIDRLQRRRVSVRELRKAQQYFRGRLWLGLEDTHAVANWHGGQEILDRAVTTPEEAASIVDNVTADDILRVARAYLQPPLCRLAAVGPITELGLETRLAGA